MSGFANRGAQLLHGLPDDRLRAVIAEIGVDLVRRFVIDGVVPEDNLVYQISGLTAGAIVPADWQLPPNPHLSRPDVAHPLLGDVGPTAGEAHAPSPPLIEPADPSSPGAAAAPGADFAQNTTAPGNDLLAAKRRVSSAIAAIADAWTEYGVAMRLLNEREG